MSQKNTSEKLLQKYLKEKQKRIKPGECEKYVLAVIDENILTTRVGKSLLDKLSDLGIQYDIRNLSTQNIIFWERITEEASSAKRNEMEYQLIRLFPAEEYLAAIQDKSINSTIENIKSQFPETQVTLVIMGLAPTGSTSGILERETEFADLQIRYGCNIHVIPRSCDEFSTLLVRFTKAIAQIPFKKQQSEIFADSKQFFRNDNKDCVRVVDGYGMARLWQQHLIRMPLVTLDVAETIRLEFSCPKKLLQALSNSSGPENLANMKITRGGNIFSTERRIGEALSKKLYTLYNSVDPMETL